MIQGLRTVVYPVTDLEEGKAWYNRVLEREPYFDEPFYVGYSVGGFELGLIPDGSPGSQGSHAFWGVPNLDAELARLTGLGAEVRLLRQHGRAAADRDRHAGGGSLHRLAASAPAWLVPSSLRPKRRRGTVTPATEAL